MTLIGPAQAGQTITSMANTRFNNKAAQSSRYVDRGAAAFGADGSFDVVDVGAGLGSAATSDDGTTFARSRLVGAKTLAMVLLSPTD